MLKPGDKVVMVNCFEAMAERNKGKVWTVASEPWMMCGSEVVKLEGKSGGFATKHLRKVGIDLGGQDVTVIIDKRIDCKVCKEPLTEEELAKGKTCVDCNKSISLATNKGQAKRRTGWFPRPA